MGSPDTAVDTVGYSGIQWIWCKMARYRDTAGYTKDTVRYRQDTGEIQAGDPKNARPGSLGVSPRNGHSQTTSLVTDYFTRQHHSDALLRKYWSTRLVTS